jgi:predicted negative regulator of RcsB-dependent stress response
VFDLAHWASEHKGKVIQGAIAIVVLVAAIAGYRWYSSSQAEARQAELAQVLKIEDATVGSEAQQIGLPHFPTQQQKDEARVKALTDLHQKYGFTQEGSIAAMYLAVDASDKGNLADAEKRFKEIVDNAPDAYASLARLSLATVYEAEGKSAEAQKILEDAVKNPTETVSKESAQLALAKVLGKTKPEEAKKLYESLRGSSRSAVSRAAVTGLGQLTQGQ